MVCCGRKEGGTLEMLAQSRRRRPQYVLRGVALSFPYVLHLGNLPLHPSRRGASVTLVATVPASGDRSIFPCRVLSDSTLQPRIPCAQASPYVSERTFLSARVVVRLSYRNYATAPEGIFPCRDLQGSICSCPSNRCTACTASIDKPHFSFGRLLPGPSLAAPKPLHD